MTTDPTIKPNVVEMAKKKRHIKILEKLQKGQQPPTKAEVKELETYERGQPDPGTVETQEQLARIFGKSVRTIANWAKDGMPQRSDGRYSITDIQLWRMDKNLQQRSVDDHGDKVQRSVAKYRDIKARREEIKLKKELGELIPREQVETGLIQLATVLKINFLSLPRTLAPQLVGMEPREIEAILDQNIKHIINRFGTGEVFVTAKSLKKKFHDHVYEEI